MKKVVIFSLADETGGPFALFQLAKAIQSFGVPVEMAFINQGEINGNEHFCKILYHDDFTMPALLGIKPTLCHQFTKSDLLIFPEVYVQFMEKIQNYGYTNTVFWWLSWQKFPIQFIEQLNIAKTLHQSKHIFQSVYASQQAQQFGHDGLIVSDYTVLENTQTSAWEDRPYDVCYLPRKSVGAESVLAELAEDYKVLKLENMSHTESLEAIAKSKIFIDFGNHPGKDRIPREAAALGCIPVVHKAGATAITQDVPLPDYLKPATKLFFVKGHFKHLITIILDNYTSILSDLTPYREQIANEKSVFYTQTHTFLKHMQFI